MRTRGNDVGGGIDNGDENRCVAAVAFAVISVVAVAEG